MYSWNILLKIIFTRDKDHMMLFVLWFIPLKSEHYM